MLAPLILIAGGMLIVALARTIQRRIVRLMAPRNGIEADTISDTIRLMGAIWVGTGVWLLARSA